MDDELIERARTGDLGACEALYHLHANRVYALVRRLAGDDSQAEDWVQEAWMRVFRSLPGFRGDARFTTWLHRVVVNTVLHGIRDGRRRRMRVVETEVPEVAVTSTHPVLRLSLEEAIDSLPAGMRHVLVLHDVEGYTHDEIAEMTGIRAGTSKSQLFKARAKLRERLSPSSSRIEGEAACAT